MLLRSRLWWCLCALIPPLDAQLTLDGGDGPGKGKHVVLLAGDEEYRSEEALPMLAKILAQRHGFRCSVLFSLGADGTIDPDAQQSLGGSEALATADVIVMALRFRQWPDDTMRQFVAAFERGVPTVALRTSTHAFHYPADSTSEFRHFSFDSRTWPGGFGRQVLGETWVAHHGEHKAEATRGIVEPGAQAHPCLRGVAEVFGDTDVYTARPPADVKILLRGQVLSGMRPSDPPVAGPKNTPMQPIAWTRQHRHPNGTVNQVFCTTMGAATDLENEGLRRLVVNAVHWAAGLEVPAAADVRPVGEFTPTAYGFGGSQRGVRPSDHQLPSAAPPLALRKGERLALVGGGLAARMSWFGHFEALLHHRFPDLELVVRNFGWPADEVGLQQRPHDYTKIDDPLAVFAPDTLLCLFGTNESFAGTAGLARFVADYDRLLDDLGQRFAKDGRAPRLILVSPAAFEDTGNAWLPALAPRQQVLSQYQAAIAALAKRRGLTFVDLLTPTAARFAAEPGAQYTLHGTDLDLAGDRVVAELLDRALFGTASPRLDTEAFERLRQAVVDKAWLHEQDYRMVNGWYVYGERRTHDTATFPAEFAKLRAMVAAHDGYVFALAQGKNPAPPDDRVGGTLVAPKTGFGTHPYSEPKAASYPTPAGAIAAMRTRPGLEVKLFASEQRFPELANPVQLNFDDRGRLWVACMPTYPQWQPGDPRPADKLLIFEDQDQDGEADRVKVFYDQLHCPTGFEFWRGGVLVVSQPRILWLEDTDGDDRADVVVPWADGFATDDTHHTIGAWEWSPGGLLTMLEGLHVSSTVETPWGPRRNRGPAGAWILDPDRVALHRFDTPGYGNPWCAVFDGWGRGLVGDGTTGVHHDEALLSGAPFAGRRSPPSVFDHQGMRPVCGSEILASRHLPDDLQGQLVYACVINMHGLTRFTLREDGGSITGERSADLLATDDATFRPVDPQIGPDGALWFGDWCALLIGHMQYSQRDPLRDHAHGRIYRLVAKDRPLLVPVTQHGKSASELLVQLGEPELRTRYRARRALRDRPRAEVLQAISAMTSRLEDGNPERDRLWCEALWAQQAQHAVDPELLQRVLAAPTPLARAAAVRVAADERERLPGVAALLARAARDPHPRVRLEAVRGLSWYPTEASVKAALAAADLPPDPWVDYTLDATLHALADVWRPALDRDPKFAADQPAGFELLARLAGGAHTEALAKRWLDQAVQRDAPSETRRAARAKLVALPSNLDKGQAVFSRACISCHRVKEQGIVYGPDLTTIGSQATPADMLEAILEPNAKIDPRYALVVLELRSGDLVSGFVETEDQTAITLRLPSGATQTVVKSDLAKRHDRAVSPMPEGLGATLAAQDLVDLVAYLASLR